MEDSPGTTATLTGPPALRVPSCKDPAAIADWCLGRGAAGLAAALRVSVVPVTVLLAHVVAALAGTDELPEIETHVWQSCNRAARSRECADLECEPGTLVSERHATMRAAVGRIGLTAETETVILSDALADVESVIIPALLPSQAVRDMKGTVPLGAIIAKTGWRQPVGAYPFGGGVTATAIMWRGDNRVAWAHEVIRPWVCTQLARRPLRS